MSRVVDFRFEHSFDAGALQVSETTLPHLILRWDVRPAPVEGGAPEPVREGLAGALLARGVVLFPDREPPAGADVPGTLRLDRGLGSGRVSRLVRASSPASAERAFEAAGHDWSQGAQWLVVVRRGAAIDEATTAFVERLLIDWAVPRDWPRGALCVVQAGVDGDMAALVCREAGELAALRDEIAERLAA